MLNSKNYSIKKERLLGALFILNNDDLKKINKPN